MINELPSPRLLKRQLERAKARRPRPHYPELKPGEGALGLRRDRADLPVKVIRLAHPKSRNKYNP